MPCAHTNVDASWLARDASEIRFENPMNDEERMNWTARGLNPDDLSPSPLVRRDMMRHVLQEAYIPKWRLMTGLHADMELTMGRAERRARVRVLVKATVLLMRKELRLHDADEGKAERSAYWEPITEVCRFLGIARSKLTAYTKELTGLSVSQTWDAVLAEGIRRRLKDALRASLQGFEAGDDRWSVWKRLRKMRKWPEWTHNEWAMSFGFSSYTRFYRACIAVYRKAPHRLELELIDELLREAAGEKADEPQPLATLAEVEAELEAMLPKGFRDEVVGFKAKLE